MIGICWKFRYKNGQASVRLVLFQVCLSTTSMLSVIAPLFVLYFLYVGKRNGAEKIGSSPAGIVVQNREPKGLNNLSNTCFLNAVLQSLYMSEPYKELVASCSFTDGSVGKELQNVFQQLEVGAPGSVRPSELAALLDLNIHEQQDAEELLLQVLNGVDESVKKPPNSLRTPSSALQIKTLQRLSCTDVAFRKDKVQRSFDLSLDITGHKDVNAALKAYFQPELLVGANRCQTGKLGVQNAMKSLYLLTDRYDGSAGAVAGSDRNTGDLPEVLVLHLKRFAFDPSTGALTKVGDPLRVPRTIDVSPYIYQPDPPLSQGAVGAAPGPEAADGGQALVPGSEYALSSVVVHTGRLDNGHYVCLARQPQSKQSADRATSSDCSDTDNPSRSEGGGAIEEGGRWFLLDDHRVRQVSEEQVLALAEGRESAAERGLSSNAYMLFYTRKRRTAAR